LTDVAWGACNKKAREGCAVDYSAVGEDKVIGGLNFELSSARRPGGGGDFAVGIAGAEEEGSGRHGSRQAYEGGECQDRTDRGSRAGTPAFSDLVAGAFVGSRGITFLRED